MTNLELEKLVNINPDDLENECQTIPERIVYLYDLHSTADSEYSCYNEAIQAAMADKYIEYRDYMIKNNVKPTENLVTNYVQADPVILEMLNKKYVLKKRKDYLYGLIQAINAKKDMVKNLSFLQRKDDRF